MPINKAPHKVWNIDGHKYEFCKICSDRIDYDPEIQFTCTDWYTSQE